MGKALAKMFGEVVGVVQVCPDCFLVHGPSQQLSANEQHAKCAWKPCIG